MKAFFIKNRLIYLFVLICCLSCGTDSEKLYHICTTYCPYYSLHTINTPQINFINLVRTNDKISFYCDSNEFKKSAVQYAKPSGYFAVYTGTTHFTAVDSKGDLRAEKEIQLHSSECLSIFALEDTHKKIILLSFKDNLVFPAKGKSMVRFINLSVESQIMALRGNGYELIKDIHYQKSTPFFEVTNGYYNLICRNTTASSKQHFKTPIELKPGHIYTVCSSGSAKGTQSKDSFHTSIIENY